MINWLSLTKFRETQNPNGSVKSKHFQNHDLKGETNYFSKAILCWKTTEIYFKQQSLYIW